MKNKIADLYLVVVFIGYTVSMLNAQESKNSESNIMKTVNNIPSVPTASCNDLGVENGWGAWKATEGYHRAGDNKDRPIYFNTSVNPAAPRFQIVNAGGTIRCSPGTNPGSPAIPTVPPGFGRRAIQLGEPSVNGMAGRCTNVGDYPPILDPLVAANGCSEKLTFPITVTAQDSNFVYAYSIFIENPPEGHTRAQAPYTEIYILDGNDTVSCSHQIYTADTSGKSAPGFYNGSCQATSTGIVTYKPWTLAGINLKSYIGKTLNVVITNSDCAKGGHACWSYWDFKCGVFSLDDVSYCVGQQVTLTAPSDPEINYNYQWYKNTNPHTGPAQPYNPGGTNKSITPKPQPGDTFSVMMIQPSGCNFRITYVPAPLSVKADFKSNGACGHFYFTDASSSGSSGTNISSWEWKFPGGTPSSSTVQNPGTILYPPGSYTATLVVKTANGCTDTISYPLKEGPPPIAKFSTSPVCFNTKPTKFTDQSVGNTTVSNWDWNFGDGSKSTVQNPSHTYSSPGTFTVTLIITNSFGCKDTFKLPTVVNPLPNPDFTYVPVCKGEKTCFVNKSSITKGSIISWSWNFGDSNSGANNTSSLKDPCHTFTGNGPYSVILTTTSDSGCTGTVTLPAVVNPIPVAKIASQNVCINAITKFIDASTTTSSTDPISQWYWKFGDGGTSTEQNPSHKYSTSGTYTVTLDIASKSGCKDSTHIVVKVYDPPKADFNDSVRGCAPVCSTFKDLSIPVSGDIVKWEWSFPGGSPGFSTLSKPNICWRKAGVYDAQLIVTNTHGCKDTVAKPRYITVYPWPTAEFCIAPDMAPVTEPVFNFCKMWTNDVVKFVWDFGDGTTETQDENPVHSYSTVATKNDFYKYKVCLNVQNTYGCWDTICHPLRLIPEFEFYIPNTFTPNGDGFNPKFYGKSRGVKDYDIWIFDRWGNQIWDCHYTGKNTDWDDDRSNPKGEGLSSYCQWDGIVKHGGMDISGNSDFIAQEDVYVWKVRLTDIFNKKHFYIGNVNIVH